MTKLKRLIITKGPIAWLLNQCKKIVLPGFQGIVLYDVFVFFVQQIKKIGLNERAAAISFNFFMAIPAGMIFLFTLVPYLPVAKQFNRELLITLHEVILNQKVFELIKGILKDIFDVLENRRTGLLSVSFLMALYFASNAMIGIMRTFDRSFFEIQKRNILRKRWTAIKLTVLLILLLFVSVLLLTTRGPIKRVLHDTIGINIEITSGIIRYLRWIVLVLLNFFSIAFIYKYATAVRIRWKIFSPGAVFACILTILTSYLFTLWVNNFGRYNQLYGSIGTVLIIMNLVYINALILLVGFELNVSITALKGKSAKLSTT